MKINIKVDEAILWFGSKTKVANVIGISKQALTEWEEFVPQKSALILYILTNGELGIMEDEVIK